MDVADIELRLRRVSERLAKSAADATEVSRLQGKLHALEDKDEEQLKKIMHLQAQVSSMQANMHKTDKSLQQTVTKEVELLDTIEERDAEIRRLEASVNQACCSCAAASVEPLKWICDVDLTFLVCRSS